MDVRRGRDALQHLNLDVHALRDGDTHDETQRALVKTEVNQALVDTHLVSFPRSLTFAARRASGGYLQGLSRQRHGALHHDAGLIGDVLDVGTDLVDLVDVSRSQLDSCFLHVSVPRKTIVTSSWMIDDENR